MSCKILLALLFFCPFTGCNQSGGDKPTEQPSPSTTPPAAAENSVLTAPDRTLSLTATTDEGFTLEWALATSGASPKYKLCVTTTAAIESANDFNSACSSGLIVDSTTALKTHLIYPPPPRLS